MITYKIYTLPAFQEKNRDHFEALLNIARNKEFLNHRVDEIVITDDLSGEISRYSAERLLVPKVTRSKEFWGIAKTVDFEKSQKIFFDAQYVNKLIDPTGETFLSQLIESYAGLLVGEPESRLYYSTTPFTDVLKLFFNHWSTKYIAHLLSLSKEVSTSKVHTDITIYTDAFKRNIKKHHYKYQKTEELDSFWVSFLQEFDFLIRRSQDVYYTLGTFDEPKEFEKTIIPILKEIEGLSTKMLRKESQDFGPLRSLCLRLLNLCFVDIPSETPMHIKILDTPKRLFKGNFVDTEQRIVAFIDILGFKKIIQKYDTDEQSNTLKELHLALEQAVENSIESLKRQGVKNQSDLSEYLEYRMFSDCICISLPFIDFENDFLYQFHSIATIIKTYQVIMMSHDFYIRGGVAVGSYYSDNNMIFSGGLVKAYGLEQEAKNPVVLIDRSIEERLKACDPKLRDELLGKKYFFVDPNVSERVFIYPFDLIENVNASLDNMQMVFEEARTSIQDDENDRLSHLVNSLMDISSRYLSNTIEYAKAQLKPEQILEYKNELLRKVTTQLHKHKDEESVNQKYMWLKELIEWSTETTKMPTRFRFYEV